MTIGLIVGSTIAVIGICLSLLFWLVEWSGTSIDCPTDDGSSVFASFIAAVAGRFGLWVGLGVTLIGVIFIGVSGLLNW